MGAALALAERGRALSWPNPNVGCVIVIEDRIVGRGWTQPGGRPHAEAMALVQASEKSRGATLYVTLEPCAHVSARGPACADTIISAGVGRVVIATGDPDPRTNGAGIERLKAAGIAVTTDVRGAEARHSMAGFLTRIRDGRPHVTLKLALSIDGAVAMGSGASRWITGDAARAHAHLLRARSDAILVGRGTLDADAPRLDIRLPGLEDRGPKRVVLSGNAGAPDGWMNLASPEAIGSLDANWLLVEGGMGAAAAFLSRDLVDTLLIYRAPIIVGDGRTLGDIGLTDLAAAHGRWILAESRRLGSDRLDIYERTR
ncbi:MAG: bifunctional diaminohydroxyphosphoribosylaminopyrimidine deaminase/5-amino-6-(5-phosphoribosylamino)uracil reductase RibD [Pseudomonadota bacterium]